MRKRIFVLVAVLVILIGCHNLETINATEIVYENEVTNLEAVVGVQSVRLSWQVTEEKDLEAVEILTRQSGVGAQYRKIESVSKDVTEVKIELPEFIEMDVKLRLISVKGHKSAGKELIGLTAFLEQVVLDEHKGRKMQIYLPKSYNKTEDRYYPTIYMMDGQNLFTMKTGSQIHWNVAETVNELVKNNYIDEVIVVGIYNSRNRTNEYVPYNIPDSRGGKQGRGGEAAKFASFLVDEIIPYIDFNYRTKPDRENRAIIGSSFGGIFSLWTALNYSEKFSMVGAMSPSIWTGDYEIVREVLDMEKRDVRIWLDTGEMEIDPVLRIFVEVLKEKGYIYGEDFVYYEQKGAGHSERAWADRIRSVLLFLKSDESRDINELVLEVNELRNPQTGEILAHYINPQIIYTNGLRYSLNDYSMLETSPENRIVLESDWRQDIEAFLKMDIDDFRPKGLIKRESEDSIKIFLRKNDLERELEF